MGIEVTNVKIYPVNGSNEQLLAFASVIFNEEFVVHNIRLVDIDSKYIVAMPNEEQNGDYRDIAHPITDKCRTKIHQAVVRTYNRHPEISRTIETEKVTP